MTVFAKCLIVTKFLLFSNGISTFDNTSIQLSDENKYTPGNRIFSIEKLRSAKSWNDEIIDHVSFIPDSKNISKRSCKLKKKKFKCKIKHCHRHKHCHGKEFCKHRHGRPCHKHHHHKHTEPRPVSCILGELKDACISGTPSKPGKNGYLNPKGPNVQFVLFQRCREYTCNIRPDHPDDGTRCGINVGIPTKIIIHGYLCDITRPMFMMLKNAYFSIGEYNIIGVDWSILSSHDYVTSIEGALSAGFALGDLLCWLIKVVGVRLEDIHIIGHNLGAQIAAMGATHLEDLKVGRITGLDPAMSGYLPDVDELYLLRPSDAILVDIIYTNIQVSNRSTAHAHLEFYPNGGVLQDGCPHFHTRRKCNNTIHLKNEIDCKYGRAYIYFAQAIMEPQTFQTQRCETLGRAISSQCMTDSDVYMGGENSFKPGIYYVKID